MTTQSQIRVVIADDQTAVREGLELLLGLLDDVRVVGSASDGDEAVWLVIEHDADVALLALRMPGCDGVEATARIRADHPRTQVMVLTAYAEDVHIAHALRAGALGYLTKDAGRVQIAGAIRAAAGQAVLDPHARPPQRSGDTGLDPQVRPAVASSPLPLPSDGAAPERLTARESEVLSLIADGLSNREIASRLYLSEATVKSHINRLFAKTGVRDRVQAMQYAHRHGIAKPA